MSFDFREVGPSRSSPEMWLTDGKYDAEKHHNSHLAVGVPGTVAGLHLAWKEQGSKPWKELMQPAIALARGSLERSRIWPRLFGCSTTGRSMNASCGRGR